jgi:MFS family permease
MFFSFQFYLPTLALFTQKIGGGNSLVGIVSGVFTITALLMRVFSGGLLDKYGRRMIFILSFVLFALSKISYMFATSIAVLIIVRLFHGFSWGIISTASNTVATDVIPKSRLSEGTGFLFVATTSSLMISPSLGLKIIDTLGFNWMFLISALIIFGTMFLAFLISYKKDEYENVEKKSKFDFFELEAAIPSLIILLLNFGYSTVITFLSLYALQYDIKNSGVFFTAYGISMIVTRLLFGKIGDRKGFNYVMIPGMLIILVGGLFLYLTNNIILLIVSGALYGAGFGVVVPTTQAMAVMKVGYNRRGAANATFFAGLDAGIGTGSVFWGFIANSFGLKTIYLFALIPMILSFLIYLLFSPRYRKPETKICESSA